MFLLAGAHGELVDTLVQIQAARDGDGIAGRGEEGYRDGDFIEVVDEDAKSPDRGKGTPTNGLSAHQPPLVLGVVSVVADIVVLFG